MTLGSSIRRRLVALIVGGVLAALVVTGQLMSCSGTQSVGERVVILSPHWEGIIKEFSWGFTDWLKRTHGIDAHVEHLDVGGGTSSILGYIENAYRAKSDSIGIDVLFGGGDSAHQALADKGLFERARLPLHVTAGLAATIGGQPLHDPLGRWYGAAMSSFGIITNLEMVRRAQLPTVTEWRDLTSPRVYGWVASGDPSSSGSVLMVFEVILQAHGFDKGSRIITQIAGNVAAFDDGGNAAPRSVALAQAAYGLCIDFYGWEQVAVCGEQNVGFVLPEDLTVITPDPIALLRGAPRRELAEKFIEYVLSEDGQKLWYLKVGAVGGPRKYGLNRLPVRRSLYGAGLPTGVTLNPFLRGVGMQFDRDLAMARRKVLAALVRATVIDVHDDLRAAWKAVIDAGEAQYPELVEEFSAPPVSGEELLRIAREEWQDPALRAERTLEWTRFARGKFAAVRRRAADLTR
jgi:ABC-type Fe3+ transport system substrate-binding protein